MQNIQKYNTNIGWELMREYDAKVRNKEIARTFQRAASGANLDGQY